MRLAAALSLLLAASASSAANVLAGRAPTGAGLPGVARLTDGLLTSDGDDWQSPAAVGLPVGAQLQWDLGTVQPLVGAALQADNNDVYVLSVSEDGARFTDVFRAGPVSGPGLQTRSGAFSARGRFVRLRAEGGDGAFSVSELELHSDLSSYAASPMVRPRWLPSHALDLRWALLVAAAALALGLTSQRSPRWWAALVLAALGGLAAWVVLGTWRYPHFDAARLNWVRVAVAGLAFLAIARELLFPVRFPARKSVVLSMLSVTAVLGVLCFLNLGRAQFFDASRGQTTFLHHYDMRTYFPIARYFRELRFDGVYVASALVVAEERGEASVDPVALRDLRTHGMTTYGASHAAARAVRARFSDERWASFTADMNYFRHAMGDGGFLGSMQDHGGNATPVWLLGARLLLGGFAASDRTLWLGVGVDALLVLLAFLALGWAFGPRTALIAATVFGAMDFYMFGSNWFGAALRHDWLALWCLGVAALKKERFALAGGLLAWSALIRAFPALAFVTLSAPVGWDLVTALWRERRAFSLRGFLASHRGYLRVALGAVVFGGLLFALSSAAFGVDAWAEWLHKVSLLNRDNHVNNLAIKTWVVEEPTAWAVTAVVLTALVLFSARKLPLAEAAAMGAALISVLFNPANYYLHVVFLLAVLAREREPRGRRRGGLAFLILTAMCMASYFTSQTGDYTAHFRGDTGVLLTALGALVLWQLVESFLPDSPNQPDAAGDT